MPDKKDLIVVPFLSMETKEVTENGVKYFEFEGYLSTFNNVDLVGDVVVPGAFRKSLETRKPKLLWQHRWDEPVGVFADVHEDATGLFVKGRMPMSDSFVSGRVIPQMKAGSIDSMSIGFFTKVSRMDHEKEIRYLEEVELIEGSLVTFPANPEARIQAIKQMKSEYSGQPQKKSPKMLDNIAPVEHIWEPEKAKERIEKSGINTDDFGCFNIFDIVNEKLAVIPRALFCLKAQVLGAKGGYHGDIEAVKSILNRYYEKMNLEAPFEKEEGKFSEIEMMNMPLAEITFVFKQGRMSKSCADSFARKYLDLVNKSKTPDVSDGIKRISETIANIRKDLGTV